MLNTYSQFNYGHTITRDNRLFPFIYNSQEYISSINIGAYTLGNFVNELARALNAVDVLIFEVSLNRETRGITISANNNFVLPVFSSLLKNISCYALAGFDFNADLSGSDTYTGEQSGFIFKPQFKLQSYIDFEDDQESAKASVAESGSGLTQVASFGLIQRASFNIKYQNNFTANSQCNSYPIRYNGNGIENLRDFLKYCTTKAPIELVKDEDAPNLFVPCFLDSTQTSSQGVGFRINELYSEGLAHYFESGNLVFRRIN